MPKQSNQSKRKKGPADAVREWVSDNLRYLLLAFGALLVIIILVLVIRAVTGKNSGGSDTSSKKTQNTAGQEQAKTGDETAQTESEAAPGEGLTENDPEILDVMSRYYMAWQEKDIAAMRSIFPDLSAEDEKDILQNEAIEGFENITVYTAPGMTEDSCAAYVWFDVKVAGINTPAPTLLDFYLEKGPDQNYQIVNKYATSERTAYMEQLKSSSGVQALIRTVNSRLQQAVSQDEDLKAYVVSLQGGATQEEEPSDSGTFAVGDEVYATTDINVRSEASTNGILYGMLSKGQAAQILEMRDDGWCKIRYTTGGTTIEGFVMTQYLSRTG